MEKLIEKINALPKNSTVYAVGGFARDLFLKRPHCDIDLAVSPGAQSFAKKLADAFNSKAVVLDDKSKIYRIMLKDEAAANIDVSLLDGKNIEEDLSKRDFTINALAFELKYFKDYKKHILSVSEGSFKDLKAKTIRTVSKNAFKDDPLRMLRAFRFCAELGFKIAPETLKLISANAALIKKSAPERIKNELFRILSSPKSSQILKQADDCGLLCEIFSEIKNMKKAQKKYYYHPGGLFEHSCETMRAAENILNNLEKHFPQNRDDLKRHFSSDKDFSQYATRAGVLKLSALFHDSAKPETAKKEGEKMRFFGHEEEGSKKIKKIMDSLKAGKKETATAVLLVGEHMRPSTLTKNNVVTKKASLKLFREIGENTPDLIVLSMADWHSYKKLKIYSRKELALQEDAARKLVKYYFEVKNAKPAPKLIDGNVIMKKFNLKPGKWIGELLNAVSQAQTLKKISNAKEALALVEKKLTQVKKKYKI